MIKNGEIILFQGDSITESGRNEKVNDLGFGYPALIAAWLSTKYPEKDIRFINRGISGDRIRDLKKRWQKDCVDLKPTLVSILIGINDTWNRYNNNDPTSLESFESDYRYIIERTRNNLDANIIVCEPFLISIDENKTKWREDLDPKIQIVRKLSREYHVFYLPLDGIMAQACTIREQQFWTTDGIHPTLAGHALIAKKWLEFLDFLR